MRLSVFGCVLALPFITFAGPIESFFTGQKFEKGSYTEMVGVPRSEENLERLKQIDRTIFADLGEFRKCYEILLKKNPSVSARAFFYFTVSKDGSFNNISADILNSSGKKDEVIELIQCAADKIKKLKSSPGPSDLAIRFVLSLEKRQKSDKEKTE